MCSSNKIALKQEDTEKEMKKKIEEKLLNGISNL